METISARLRQQYPDTNNKRFDRVVSLQKHLIGETSTMFVVAVWRRRIGFSNRLCERREPSAGAFGFTSKGDGHPRSTRGISLAGHPTGIN
jgi:hypothetical protein